MSQLLFLIWPCLNSYLTQGVHLESEGQMKQSSIKSRLNILFISQLEVLVPPTLHRAPDFLASFQWWHQHFLKHCTHYLITEFSCIRLPWRRLPDAAYTAPLSLLICSSTHYFHPPRSLYFPTIIEMRGSQVTVLYFLMFCNFLRWLQNYCRWPL